MQATRDDVILIKSPVEVPAGSLKNALTEASQHGMKVKFACPYKCLLTCDAGVARHCIAKVLLQASRGDFDQGLPCAGRTPGASIASSASTGSPGTLAETVRPTRRPVFRRVRASLTLAAAEHNIMPECGFEARRAASQPAARL